MNRIEVIVFPNTTVLALYVGEEKGFFAEQGLDIRRTGTPTSTFQITNLLAGKYQVAIGAFDNIIAYNEGQGAVVPETEPDLFAFMGVARMNLQLVVQEDIRTYDDLRGRTLAVDAKASGFVGVLCRMLEIGGLGPDDYELVPVGTARWRSLLAREHAGALMTDNYMSGELTEGRLHVLGNSIDLLPPYQSAVGTACRSWAADNRILLIGFIRAYVACLDWLFEPANRQEAAAILAYNREGMSNDAARRAVAQLVGSEREGLTRKAALEPAALQTVLDLRTCFGEPKKALGDLSKYVDLTYYEAALIAGRS